MSTTFNTLAAEYAGREPGSVRAACPSCGKGAKDTAVSITVMHDGSVVAHCHRCDESGAAPSPRHTMNGAHKRPAARARPHREAEDHATLWASGVEPGEAVEHPYLTRKQVGAHDIRIKDDVLLIPMHHIEGELVGVQKIDADGRKLYTRGAKKTGALHLIGTPVGRIIVAEGFATAASIHETTGVAVACAFDCANVVPVSQSLRATFPRFDLIIAADDDYQTAGNPGITAATAAAKAVNGTLAIPRWPDGVDRGDGTDFNDLRIACGDEAVQRAIANAKAPEVPEGQPDAPNTPAADPRDRDTLVDVASGWPPSLDLRELAQRDPEPPRFIVRDWLPAGYSTLFAGHGGVGKSAIGLHLGTCIALGQPFFGLEVERCKTLFLSCEDREGVLHWRLAHIARHMGITLEELHDALDVLDLVGHESVLWDRDPRTGHTITPAFGHLMERVERSGTKVLFVDGVSDTYGGNENARPDVKRYINALLSVLPIDGALVLLGHVNRVSAASPATVEGYSGSTAWHNAVRSRWYLYPETERDADGKELRSGRLILELQKSNLGGDAPSMTFRYDEEARLFVGTGLPASDLVESIRRRTEQRDILRAMDASAAAGVAVPAAMQGPRTAYLVLSHRPEFPDSLRGDVRPKKRRFGRHIEDLRQIRHIAESSIRRSGRHTLAILEVTSEGRAEYANT